MLPICLELFDFHEWFANVQYNNIWISFEFISFTSITVLKQNSKPLFKTSFSFQNELEKRVRLTVCTELFLDFKICSEYIKLVDKPWGQNEA